MVRVIAGGLPDLETKVVFIQDFLRQGCQDPEVARLAQDILAEAGPSQVSRADPWSVAVTVYRWVRRTIAFERDPLTGELADIGGQRLAGPVDLIQNVAATLERGRGDCVALTVLLGSLACSLGLPVRIGLQDTLGRGIDHVLLLVGLPLPVPQEWFPLDLTAEEPGTLRPGGPVVMVGV